MPTYHFMVGKHGTMAPFKRIKVTGIDLTTGKRTTVRTNLNGVATLSTTNAARIVVHTYEDYELLSLTPIGVNVDMVVDSHGGGTHTELFTADGALEDAIATGEDRTIWLCTTHNEEITASHAMSSFAANQRIAVLSAGYNRPVLEVNTSNPLITVDGTSLSGVGSVLSFKGFALTRTHATPSDLMEVSGGGILPHMEFIDIGLEEGSSGWTHLIDTDTVGSGQVRGFVMERLHADTTVQSVANVTLTSASTGTFRLLNSDFVQLTHFMESSLNAEMGVKGIIIKGNIVKLMKGYALRRRYNFPLVMDDNVITEMDAAIDWLDLGSSGSVGIRDADISNNYLYCSAAGASAFHIETPVVGSVNAIAIIGNVLVGPGSGTAIKVDDPAPGTITGCLIQNAYRGWDNEVVWGGSGSPGVGGDHGLLSGLADDDHTQYALLLGRSGGQTLIGGTDASDALQLESTSHGTKGPVVITSGSTLEINDSDYLFFLSSGDPQIIFDHAGGTTDRFRFERDTPTPGIGRFLYEIAEVTKLGVGVSDIQVGVAGSAPALLLEAMDATAEGGELELRGAAAFTDWHYDNYMGALRWYESSTVRMHLAGGASPKLTVFGEVESLGSIFRLTNKGNVVKDFGDATIGASQDTVTAEEQNARKVTLEAGRYTLLSAHGKTVSGTASVRYAIYTDNVGVPDALVGYTATITVDTTDQWWPASIAFDENGNDISFYGSVTIEEAGTYWISIHSDGDVSNLEWDYHTGGVSYEGNADAFADGPEGTWAGGAGGTKGYSFFARAAPLGILYTARVGTGDTNFYYETSQGTLVGPLMGHNNARLPDDSPLYFGDDDDASIQFVSATGHLTIDPREVGAGDVRVTFGALPDYLQWGDDRFEQKVQDQTLVYNLTAYGAGAATTPILYLRRADGSIASPTYTKSSAFLGSIFFSGLDGGASWRIGAGIKAIAREDFDATPQAGTDFEFFVTPSGSTNNTRVARFREDYLMVNKIRELTDVGVDIEGVIHEAGYTQYDELGADPTNIANAALLYSKDDATVTKLYYRQSDGTVVGPLTGAGAAAPHGVLDSVTHDDTVTNSPPAAGSIIIANSTPKWDELAISVPAANVLNVLGVANGDVVPAWKTLFDGSNPEAVGVADPGTALVASHRDHVHAHPAALGTDLHHAQAHAAAHADGGADELAVQDLASDAATAGQIATADGAGAVAFKTNENVITFTVEDPAAVDSIAFHFTYSAVTVREAQTAIVGGTSVVFNVYHGTNRGTAVAGAQSVWSGDETADSTNTKNHAAPDGDVTIPADSWLVLDLGTVTGSVDELNFSLRFTYD